MSTQIQNQFQNLLLKKFTEIQKRNPGFSLRAFAKKLDVSAAALSEVLRGRRAMSVPRMEKVLVRLQLTPEEIHATLTNDGKAKLVPREFLQLSSDQYHTVADWYHFAILSLIETEDFRGDVDTISQRLSLPRPAAAQAVERLERLGLLEVKRGSIVGTGKQISTTDNIKDLALQRAHQQNLELAQKALDQQTVDERDFLSLTFAMDPLHVPLVKKKIREFLSELNDEMEAKGKKKVYKTNIQFFKLEGGL